MTRLAFTVVGLVFAAWFAVITINTRWNKASGLR